MEKIFDVTIIGAGINGAFLARELSRYNINILLLEKESSCGTGGTKAGLSQVHSVAFSPANTLKGRLSIDAANKFKKVAMELNLSFREADELWLALNDDEVKIIKDIKERGEKYHANDLSIISAKEVLEIEPNINPEVKAALRIKNLGVVYPPEWCFALVENSIDNGVIYKNFSNVRKIERLSNNSFKIFTDNEVFESRFLVNVAGLNAGEIAHLTKDEDLELIYKKGTMLIFDKAVSGLVNNMIIGVPSPDFSRGVAPTVHGNIIAGLGYFTKPKDGSDTSVERGKIEEVISLVKNLVPALNLRDVITSFAGVYMINNKCPNGDYYINYSKNYPEAIHALIGAPGLTTAPGAAAYIINLLKEAGLKMPEKENIVLKKNRMKKFSLLKKNEIKDFIQQDKKRACIICRCEKVTEAEIIEVVQKGGRTVDKVKHYTRAGMGRCQGGFCTPSVLKIISNETGYPISEIVKNSKGSEIVKGYSKS